jgi:cellulose synthase/poly-beta-1,6-N-acetylglucosamine synthase-like glycosyltransferase
MTLTGIVVAGGVLMGGLFAAYSLAINFSFLMLTVLAAISNWRQARQIEFAGFDESFTDPLPIGVSVLMPAFNEESTIVDSVQAMRALRYPDFEIIVIDDGSSDQTMARLIDHFAMVEAPIVVDTAVPMLGAVRATFIAPGGDTSLLLVQKDNGGKADALNVGMNVARKPLVCMVDADSLLDPEALLHVTRPFADDPTRVVASGGVVRVANGSLVRHGRVVEPRMPRRALPRIQVVEYVRAFLVGRAGWSEAGGLLIISGAFGLFRADAVRAVGGLATDCIGEDAELVVRLHRQIGDEGTDARIVFVPEPVAWTEVPEDLRTLARQRRRWHRGLTEVFARHKSMIFRRRYGVIGMLTLPWFWLFELMAPVVELLGLVYFAVVLAVLWLEDRGVVHTDFVDGWVVVLLLACSLAFAFAVSLLALVSDELSFGRYSSLRDQLRAVTAVLQEHVGYRQLTAWWRVRGMVDGLRGSKQEWGDMKRRGFGASQSGDDRA